MCKGCYESGGTKWERATVKYHKVIAKAKIARGTWTDTKRIVQVVAAAPKVGDLPLMLHKVYKEIVEEKGTLFLISEHQTLSLIEAIEAKFASFSDQSGFNFTSFIIVMITRAPWTIPHTSPLTNSGVCYFGNMGEAPVTADAMERVILNPAWLYKGTYGGMIGGSDDQFGAIKVY